MHYKYISLHEVKNQRALAKNEIDRCKISKWELVVGAPDRVNIPCLMHDTCLCQLDVKMYVCV